MWSIADIADALESGLGRHAAHLDAEQAIYGLDNLDELALHPLLAQALESAGYGVHREQRYPADRLRRSESEGERCDLVLTPDRRPLVVPEAKATLFEPADAVPPDEAFWLEVKIVAQFTSDGPNRAYASQLLANVRRDVTKLAKDREILHSGLLIVLFAADRRVAEHDLGIWHARCLERSLPIGAPALRLIGLNDRIGNGLAAIALYPVHHL